MAALRAPFGRVKFSQVTKRDLWRYFWYDGDTTSGDQEKAGQHDDLLVKVKCHTDTFFKKTPIKASNISQKQTPVQRID